MLLMIHLPYTLMVTAQVRHFASKPSYSESVQIESNEEVKFLVGGKLVSVADAGALDPSDRTVAHWQLLVDWDLQASRPYVVVDPFDPRGLLYLSRSEYLLQSRVALQNELTLMVVARPGTTRPQPSKKSPPQNKGTSPEFSFRRSFRNRTFLFTWKEFIRLRSWVANSVKVEDGMASVDSSSIERIVLVWGRTLLHYASITSPERRLQGFLSFAQHLRESIQHNGINHTAKRLKIYLYCVYSYLSGNPLSSTQDLGFRVRLSHGLPRALPSTLRAQIRSGNLSWIRITVSLLNIYRAFKVTTPDPETAYETIRKPLPNLNDSKLFEQFKYFARNVFPTLVKEQAMNAGRPLKSFSYKSSLGDIIRTAAANLRGSASTFSLILDAKAWMQSADNHVLQWFYINKDFTSAAFMKALALESHFPESYNLRKRAMEIFPAPPFKNKESEKEWTETILKPLVNEMKEEGSLVGSLTQFESAVKPAWELKDLSKPIKGRLFNFDAPGGKLRTVAICDYWTQIAMKPVHDRLFDILRALHLNDGTFDQQGTVDRYWKENLRPHWSFDLSAATDSIPATLYTEVLAPFLMDETGEYAEAYEKAKLWLKVMVDRDFGLPSPKKGEKGYDGTLQYRTIRYGTGQPMGAYSSWASMALVHHALVQFSNWIGHYESPENAEWFKTYLILGDDVDIAKCRRVSENYLSTCNEFLIKIGLHKSLQSSKNFFEFANQRLCEAGNISPISFLEEVTSQSWKSRIEFARRISSRFGVSVNHIQLLRLVTTARQWQALLPELGGQRASLLHRILKFILLNPFQPNWHTEMDVNIESINSWLSNLEETAETTNFSNQERRRLEVNLCKKIATAIRVDLEKIFTSLHSVTYMKSKSHEPAPNLLGAGGSNGFKMPLSLKALHLDILGPQTMGHYKDHTTELYNPTGPSEVTKREDRLILSQALITHYGLSPAECELMKDFFGAFDIDALDLPKRCPVAYLYLFSSAYKHNELCRKQAQDILDELIVLEKKVEEFDVLPGLIAYTSIPEKSPLAELLLLFIKLGNVSEVLRFDRNLSLEGLGRKTKTTDTALDRASAIMELIIPEYAKWTGIAIHRLPYVPTPGTGFLARIVSSCVKYFKKYRADREQIKMSLAPNLAIPFNKKGQAGATMVGSICPAPGTGNSIGFKLPSILGGIL